MDKEPLPPAPIVATIQQSAPIWRLVLFLAWPVLLQQLLILLVSHSDRFLAGFYQPGDPDQHVAYQSAQTTATYLNWVISNYTVLVSVGSTALVARFIGASDRALAIRVTNQSIVLAAVVGLVGSALGLATLEPLVRFLQLQGAAAEFAASYLKPLFYLLVFLVIQAAGIACLVGAGDTRTGLWVKGGVAVVNLPMAWGFFHGLGPLPSLGFPGIALGTALSETGGCLVVLVLLTRGRAGLRLHRNLLWPDWTLLRRILRVSVPAGVDSFSIVFGQLWFLRIINKLGNDAASAHGIAIGWEAMGYLSGGAFGTAAMTLVGQNLGAGKPGKAAHSGWVAFGLGCAFMSAMGAVFFILAPQMFWLFCPNPEQQPVIEAGVPVLRLVAFAMPPLASCIIFTYALRGAGDTRVPVLFTWFGFLAVRIPLAYLLTGVALPWGVVSGLDLGLFGAWLAMFADIVVRGLFFLLRFAGGRWRSTRV